jgi:hypothetical protein
VDHLKEKCDLYVDLDQTYNYCCELQKVKYYNDGEKDETGLSCEGMVSEFGVEEMSCGGVSC